MKKLKKQIIAVVGMPGAGKTTACDFFRKKQIPILRFGDETDLGLKELGKPLTERNERWYREKLRSEWGMGAYARKIKPRLEQALKTNSLVILDGLYSWEEYEYLKKFYENLSLLCIFASPGVRYRRLLQRKVRSLKIKEARERDIAELINLHKGPPIALADYLIINEGMVSKLNKALKELFTKWQQ